VNLAMLGEQSLGCASGCKNAAFLALGTGTGLGLLIDGKLFRGARGAAGEISDLPIARDPTSQTLSTMGAFELEVGSVAIVDRYRRQGGTSAATVRDIFRRLEEGDEVAASVLDATARWVALAVVTLQSLLDLELIVFGGSIGVRPELYERVQKVLPSLFSRRVTIAPSQLGDRAGLIGAVCAAAHARRRASGCSEN
jgi:predicted NBD/HSP70 family sugar kinase